eukprot:11391150-Alexandrium_andersonii.AAC.1
MPRREASTKASTGSTTCSTDRFGTPPAMQAGQASFVHLATCCARARPHARTQTEAMAIGLSL